MLAAYKITGDEKYLCIARAFGNWIIAQDELAHYATRPALCNPMLDLFRVTGDRKFLDWVLQQKDGILILQVIVSSDPNAEGGFRGEDEKAEWYFGGNPMDYVLTRVTAYAALTLAKLSGKAFGPGYSTFGDLSPVKK